MNRESFVLLGGTAALLLQVAHPLVAAGVSEHSDFRRDPIGRLMRTLNTTLAMVFGTTPQAKAALVRVDRRHLAVRGTAPSGKRYDAHDPRLVVWVQTTLVLTSLRLYELVMGPLTGSDRESYWQEARFFARQLGATDAELPSTYADLVAYERAMLASEVIPDANAIAVGHDVLRPVRWLPGPLLWGSHAMASGLVPPSLRLAFGLPWRARERLFFRAVIVALRFVLPLLPDRIRYVPQARRYEVRLR